MAAARAGELRAETDKRARPRKKKALTDLLRALGAAGVSLQRSGVPARERSVQAWFAQVHTPLSPRLLLRCSSHHVPSIRTSLRTHLKSGSACFVIVICGLCHTVLALTLVKGWWHMAKSCSTISETIQMSRMKGRSTPQRRAASTGSHTHNRNFQRLHERAGHAACRRRPRWRCGGCWTHGRAAEAACRQRVQKLRMRCGRRLTRTTGATWRACSACGRCLGHTAVPTSAVGLLQTHDCGRGVGPAL